ncbi:MAG: hypothetical protein IT209_00725 [Armatimonadetes bacterium]|nr:hypothetical protein [Armatimonadota bacterium]
MSIITSGDLSAHLGAAAAAYSATQLAQATSAANARVETYCGRIFAAADYGAWLNVARSVILPQTPVNYIKRIGLGRAQIAQLYALAGDAHSLSLSITSGVLRLVIVGGVDAGVDSFTLSTYASLSALKSAVELGGKWTCALAIGYENETPSALAPVSTSFPNIGAGAGGWLYGPANYNAEYSFDPDSGVVRLENWFGEFDSLGQGERKVYVEWRGGYDTIPGDVIGAALGIAKDVVISSDRHSAITSERIGDYSYSTGSGSSSSGVSGQSSVNVGDFAATLDRYRIRGVSHL